MMVLRYMYLCVTDRLNECLWYNVLILSCFACLVSVRSSRKNGADSSPPNGCFSWLVFFSL